VLVSRGCILDWRASHAAAFTPLRRANGRAVDHTIGRLHGELKRRTNANAVLTSAPLPCCHIVLSSASIPQDQHEQSRRSPQSPPRQLTWPLVHRAFRHLGLPRPVVVHQCNGSLLC
jgi:hypothetical protein